MGSIREDPSYKETCDVRQKLAKHDIFGTETSASLYVYLFILFIFENFQIKLSKCYCGYFFFLYPCLFIIKLCLKAENVV